MSVLLLILGLFLFLMLVVVHEFVHFIAARRNGVEVEEFIYTRNLFNFTFFSSNNTDTYYNEISKSFLGTTTACSLAA